jgi:hypothetical protein
MSAKTCENCGCFGGCSHSADDPDVCSGWKSIIPASAQSFVICNGRVKVWAVKEKVPHGDSCQECDFNIPSVMQGGHDCTAPKAPCMMSNYYRIVAVELVEGE